MPDVSGKTLDVALDDIRRAGFDDDPRVVGGGLLGVIDEANWQVCEQSPAAGEAISVPPELTVDRSCSDDPLVWEPGMLAMDLDEYREVYGGGPIIRGTVLGVRGITAEVVIDFGEEFAVEVPLARVGALTCGPTSLTGANFNHHVRAIRDALPSGTQVIGPIEDDGKGDAAYIHKLSSDGSKPAGPSINEVVVRLGQAEPEDAPILSLPQFGAETVEQASQKLRAWKPPKKLPKTPDAIYWPALKEAWIAAWSTKTGHVAGCVAEAARERSWYAGYVEEMKAYEPGGELYDPNWSLEHYDGLGDGNCDTCYWLRKLF